jgi:hypothetical protein
MFKFLRKYNKWILAVGGTLLMIVFLVPNAIQTLSQRAATSGAGWATVGENDRKVTVDDLNNAQLELQAMDRMGRAVPGFGRINDPRHWFLLSREAEQAGLVGTPLLTPDVAEQLRQVGLSRDVVARTMAKLGGVELMLALYQGSTPYSDRRLKTAAENLFYEVQIQPVIIEADGDAIDYEPTEQEILEQMEAHAEELAGDEGVVFGYKLADRVKIEWLTITADAVRAAIEASDALSGTALRTHWMRNEGIGDIPLLPETPATTIPDAVREHLLQELTDEKIADISRFASNQLRARTHPLSRADGYLILGDDWEQSRLDLRELATSTVEKFEIELPVYESSGEWLDMVDLRDIDGFGEATTDKYPPGLKDAADLIIASKEFEGSTTIPMQAGVVGPPMRDADDNLYFYRVLDTDASRAPTSVDEVREQVVADLKRKKHFDRLAEQITDFEAHAERDGMMAVAMANETPVQRRIGVARYDPSLIGLQQQFGLAMTPTPTRLPIIGANEQAIDEIIAYARELSDTPIDELTEEQRIASVAVEDALALLVYRIIRTNPVTLEQYATRTQANMLQRILLQEEFEDAEWIDEVFGYDALAARHNFKVPDPEPEDIEGTEDAETADLASADAG